VVAVAEPLSPELVMVSEDLRAAAIAALPDPSSFYTSLGPQARAAAALPRDDPPVAGASREASLVVGVLRYVAWHAALGAFLGFGLVAAVVLSLLIIGLFA
jgi:hypothetical protein